MNKYEILYIIRCDVEEGKRTSLIQKYQNVITNLSGTIDSVQEIGMKKFAYEIDKKSEGYYVLMNVTCAADTQAELDRQMRNDESIVRQMILSK